jgi:hypothetical protein
LTSLLFFTVNRSIAQSADSVEISLLTCTAGSEGFSSWGHSALRVRNLVTYSDVVYNFGLFDFETPGFYRKFLKGTLDYMLGSHNTVAFVDLYVRENRQVTEQILNLPTAEKERILKRLEYLDTPRNRFYKYQFLSDNCTTQLRDLLPDESLKTARKTKTEYTYRYLINRELSGKYWLRFGINLILGSSLDRPVSEYESMFLPDILQNKLDHLAYNGSGIVKETKIYNEIKPEESSIMSLIYSPFVLFSLIFLLIVVLRKKFLDYTLLALAGTAGLVLIFLEIYSGHPELNSNFNLIWCNPLYLSLLFPFRKNPAIKRRLAMLLAILPVLATVLYLAGVQRYDPAVFPLISAQCFICARYFLKK